MTMVPVLDLAAALGAGAAEATAGGACSARPTKATPAGTDRGYATPP